MPNQETVVGVDLGILSNTCFVIMPFAGTFNTVYERVIRPAVEEAGLACLRADEVFSKPQITHDIWKQIRSCRLVVAELTGRNPNVLYELGLAHAIGKPAVIMTRNEADVPFDLKALRYLFYDIDDPFWGETLKGALSEMCVKIIGTPDFGTVLDGIKLPIDAEIQEIHPTSRIDAPLFDLTGTWHGSADFSPRGRNYYWVVQLGQEGNILYGSASISYTISNQLETVHQTLTGEIIGDTISFHGTSYSFINQASDSGDDYDLDDFVGEILDGGNEIEGVLTDTADRRQEARLTLQRQSVNRDNGFQ